MTTLRTIRINLNALEHDGGTWPTVALTCQEIAHALTALTRLPGLRPATRHPDR